MGRRFLPGIVLAVLAAGCAGPQAVPEAEVVAEVTAFLEGIPARLAAAGPTAWLDVFAAEPGFFMASDGQVAFPDRAAAEAFLADFAPRVEALQLAWDEVRVVPLSATLAAVGTSYAERIDFADGTVARFTGYMTGLARRATDGWRLQHLHWSSPRAPED